MCFTVLAAQVASPEEDVPVSSSSWTMVARMGTLTQKQTFEIHLKLPARWLNHVSNEIMNTEWNYRESLTGGSPCWGRRSRWRPSEGGWPAEGSSAEVGTRGPDAGPACCRSAGGSRRRPGGTRVRLHGVASRETVSHNVEIIRISPGTFTITRPATVRSRSNQVFQMPPP